MQTGSRRSGRKRKHESSSSNEPDTVQGDSDPCHSKETAKKSADTGTQPTQAQASLKTPDESIVQEKKASDESDIPTYYETVPTLQNMSSIAAVIELWRQVIRTPDCEEESRFLGFGHNVKLCQHFVSKLAMPGLIRECVGNYLLRVLHEMEKWFQDYKKLLDEPLVTDILFCSWLSEGKIDYRASALNMLSNPRLTLVDKFKIMCKYCLEEEIKKNSVECFPFNSIQKIDFNDQPLIYYWLCYMKNDLDKIPDTNEESIASYMITVSHVDNWSAIEYFWDHLNVDEQTSKIEKILYQKRKFQKQLLCKMNESQKFMLYSKIPFDIMKNFWDQPSQVRFACSIWIYIRNFVDQKQFQQSLEVFTYYLGEENLEEKVRCMLDISNHRPDHLKEVAFHNDFMSKIIAYNSELGDKQLIADYLSLAGVELRKEIIFEQADELVSLLDPSLNDQLIELCLPNAEDVKKFKKYVLLSFCIQNRLCEEVCKRDLKSITWFLDCYCTDSHRRSEFCSTILKNSGILECQFYNMDGWINVIEFIDENVLPSLPYKALEFKKQVACSFADFFHEIWSQKDEVRDMIGRVTQVLDVEDVEKFEEFEKTVLIHRIFDRSWQSSQNDTNQKTLSKLFAPLDKCLRWRFENASDVKGIDLDEAFDDCDKNDSMISPKDVPSQNEFSWNTLLWCFGGDRDSVQSLKKTYESLEFVKYVV